MIFKQKKHRLVACAAAASCIALALFSGFPQNTEYAKATPEWRFDFGASVGTKGYIPVVAGNGYNTSRGWGFADKSLVKNVSAAGTNELSHAVQFTSTSDSNTFNVDLPTGLYEIKVKLGNTFRASVKAEGVYQIMNMTGDNAVDSFTIPVTDGQLNIMVTEGKEGTDFTLSALEIKKVSDNIVGKPTIWACGDSTVCNYYPLSSSTQAGWVQMLGKYIDTSKFDIRNMATGGQYAKGFIADGQFAPIEKYGKAGDYFIISIGINDQAKSNRTEYEEAVTYMTQRAKAKGMTVILVKQQGRADDITVHSNPLLKWRWYSDVLEKIGAAENVQVLDLFTPAQNYWLSIGQDAVYKLFMPGDTLHPNRQGADKLAELAAKELDFKTDEP